MSISEFPGFDKIFLLSEAFRPRAMRFTRRSLQFAPLDVSRSPSSYPAFEPLDHDEGSKLYDFAGTTRVRDKIVSAKFVDVLRSCRARGWAAHPAELFDRQKAPIADYFWLIATSECGPTPNRGNRIVRQEPRVAGGEAVFAEVGVTFDPLSWDGSEIFRPATSHAIYVVDRVRHALVAAKVTNVNFQPVSEYVIMLHEAPPW
jgi:hypothetical protein